MCGIFAFLATQDQKIDQEHLSKCKDLIQYRGPDNTQDLLIQTADYQMYFGFHRLAINGLGHDSDEPLLLGQTYLICNGEIYNHKQLIQEHQLPVKTHNDCEVILHLYQRYGFPKALHLLDGVFAFVLFDTKKQEIYVANDPIGIRPLYYGITQSTPPSIAWASEPIALRDAVHDQIRFFPPGCYQRITPNLPLTEHQEPINIQRWYHYQYNMEPLQDITWRSPAQQLNQIKHQYQQLLIQAVEKRITNGERPIACLLSGGLDSSLVSSIAAHLLENHPEVKSDQKHKLATFSIGLPDSPDTYYADLVSKHIGSHHTTVTIQEQEFLDAIPEVIRAIQSYDITTVRASVGNYLISKYIAENTPYKIILNGDVSEEINASYFYSSFAPSTHKLYQDNLKLLKEVHMYDVLRSARCIENQGLEARTPFADKQLVDFVMSLPPSLKSFGPNYQGRVEKQLLRESFDDPSTRRSQKDLLSSGKSSISQAPWLPKEILYRPKTAFSDGVSNKKRSWHHIIQEYIEKHLMTDQDWQNFAKQQLEPPYPPTPEAYYYFKIYRQIFPDPNNQHKTSQIIPRYWMPRFVPNPTNDPSARVLTDATDR